MRTTSKFFGLLVLFVGILFANPVHSQCLDSTDVDNDGIIACNDNCPDVYNPDQEAASWGGVGQACCCGLYTGGYPGNTDCSTDGKRSLADVTALINSVYMDKEPLCCMANGDANYNGKMALDDINALIDFVYIGHREFEPCQ